MSRCTVDGHPTPVSFDDPLHRGQAHARPLVIFFPVPSPEEGEQLRFRSLVKTDPVICYLQEDAVSRPVTVHIDPRICGLFRELHGIVEFTKWYI